MTCFRTTSLTTWPELRTLARSSAWLATSRFVSRWCMCDCIKSDLSTRLNRESGTPGKPRAAKVGRLGSIPGQVLPKIWKTMLTSCPASCSVLMGGCMGTLHARCCHWLATSAAFTAKAVNLHLNKAGVDSGASKRSGAPLTSHDTPQSTKRVWWNWTRNLFALKRAAFFDTCEYQMLFILHISNSRHLVRCFDCGRRIKMVDRIKNVF